MTTKELRDIQDEARKLENRAQGMIIRAVAEIAINLRKMNIGNGIDPNEPE